MGVTRSMMVYKAQGAAQAKGYTDVLYLDCVHKKYLEEVSSCNVFVVKGNVISTPAIKGTILPGITRKSIIDVARSQGFQMYMERGRKDRSRAVSQQYANTLAIGTHALNVVVVEERLVTVDELLDADEVFCTGTAVVVSPVGSITYHGERLSYGNGGVGVVSQQLYAALTRLQMGLTEDKMNWVVEKLIPDYGFRFWLLKEKLGQMGKSCSFKNYDLIQSKIMRLNPPFGVQASLANQFIEKALTFKPKLLIHIVSRETILYTSAWLVKPMWGVIKFLHGRADLTLVPSAALAKELPTKPVCRLTQSGCEADPQKNPFEVFRPGCIWERLLDPPFAELYSKSCHPFFEISTVDLAAKLEETPAQVEPVVKVEKEKSTES
ncbi:hypothetical protein RHSIM_Rhsim10G0086000 [Rhododendron simsii]|uniref:Branched-chain-amino-acid aminotransferase n=1 Tax=Rhododendron simsii TaxID=118357 RepID=A0A834GBG8_RHOSS|nr:hypothetical protein RHSIM_Rhsim10G0086000 [Rhododendron simsii]